MCVWMDYHFILPQREVEFVICADERPLLNYGLILADPLSKFCTTYVTWSFNSQHFRKVEPTAWIMYDYRPKIAVIFIAEIT